MSIYNPDVKPSLLVALSILLILLGLSACSIIQLQPPRALPVDTAAEQFSALRASSHIEVIASQPRPSGSLGHRQTRDYILKTLSDLGISAVVQNHITTSTRWGMPFDSAIAENIVGELPGRANSKSILLVCHYDSTPNSLGASDDGSGVAVLLETARALVSSGPLENNIILLFTDAEEGGALGAKAFVEQYEKLDNVGLVLNFDARGNRGPALLFDTSPENGYLMEEFTKAVPHPLASSAFYEVARLLGHITDFRPFKDAAIAGFNFAFCEGITHYHTPIDNTANLDKRSLQHQGEYALSLSRHFGNLKLT
ncbi:MAG: M20/M25/M40 family metallo-hydrolase [Acidobacteriota bacterium]